MSIEGARDALQSARGDLVSGREAAKEGQTAADATFSKFAEAEGHRNGLSQKGEELLMQLRRTEELIVGVRNGAYEAAKLQKDLGEVSLATGAAFTKARAHGEVARDKLAEVLGAEAAAKYNPCVDHSKKAVRHATNTARRADTAEQRTYVIANRLKELTEKLGHISAEAIVLVHALPYSDMSPSEALDILMRNEIDDTSERRIRAANDPAGILENGTAAIEAFDGAIQSVDERLGNL